jgi:hypothetical protein
MSATSNDLKPSAGVRNIVTQDGAVLLDVNQGLCFSMNPVAARIWEMLKMNLSLDEITDALASECCVPREQVLEDVRGFVSQLHLQKLLVPADDSQKRKSGLIQRFLPRRSRIDSGRS